MYHIRKYLFQFEDSWSFEKFILLVQFAGTLVCKPGFWGSLGAPEVVAFLTSNMYLPTVLSTFC